MSTPDVVCPLSEQRTAREVLIRYFALQIGVLVIYGHFGSLQNIQSTARWCFLILGYYFNPLLPGLLALRYVVVALWRFNQHGRPKRMIRTFLAASVGKRVFIQESGDDHPTEIGLLQSWEHIEAEAPVAETGIVRLGRLVVLLFTAVQCSGALILAVRRQQRETATRLDIWCFIMAVSGLCILLQSIVALTLTPTLRVNAMPMEVQRESDAFSIYVSLCEAGLFIVSWGFIVSLLGPLPALSVGGAASAIFLNLLWFFIGWVATAGLLSPKYRPLPKAGFLNLAVGFVIVGFFRGFLFYIDIGHLLKLSDGPWPEDQPCPLLWKDSFADGILAF